MNWLICTIIFLLAFVSPFSHADDIEVFRIPSPQKPNVLFVMDRSGSMNLNLAGDQEADPGLQRGNILRRAFNEVLASNQDKINAGLGPMYNTMVSGVLWPISDLAQNAAEIDNRLGIDDGMTSLSIMDKIYGTVENNGDTNIVGALYESARYFAGETPSLGAYISETDFPGPRNKFVHFSPWTWDSVSLEYSRSKHYTWVAPNPASHTPSDIYTEDSSPSETSKNCLDYRPGGLLINECDQFERYDSCTRIAAGTARYCEDSNSTCSAFDIDGNCSANDGVCNNYIYLGEHDLCVGYNHNYYEPTVEVSKYISPISSSCQTNSIVLISDGEPSVTSLESQNLIDLVGTGNCEDLSQTIFTDSDPSIATAGNCAKEIVHYLANNDQNPNIPDSKVRTYTIGFANEGSGEDYLRQIAEAGNGEFYSADNTTELNEAFDDLLETLQSKTSTFTNISVDVNRATFSSSNKAFFSLFEPSRSQIWSGNIKGYYLTENGLEDINGLPAVRSTPEGPVFETSAQSFWSDESDGSSISKGGVNENLRPLQRNLYTFTGASVPQWGARLTLDDHALKASNTNIKDEMLDGADRSVLDWVVDQPIADPLHTTPVSIQYEGRLVVYAMTNQGFLHAFDATNPVSEGDTSGGRELWAFMPQALLANLGRLRTNSVTGPHTYGMDGGITRWLDESISNDGVISPGERAILYVGMRRGGNQYFAIDVSNPESPELLWRATGGSDEYPTLGQTWSRMALTTMMVNNQPAKVLVMGGGYSAVNDGTAAKVESPDVGSDVYIIDAATGEPLWRARDESNPAMKYAIPSDITVLDTNEDGLADRLYFADLGGQVWRTDFESAEPNSSSATLTLLADFGSSGEFHPFYYKPVVANLKASEPYLAVTLGSGSRDNPLNANSSNAIFMIKDENIDTGEPIDTSPYPLTKASLYDATLNDLGSNDLSILTEAQNQYASLEGWFIQLMPGEKVLAETALIQEELLFTTFSPPDVTASSGDSCIVNHTAGRFYHLNLQDATPVMQLSGTGEFLGADRSNRADRSRVISTYGIPGNPVLVFPENSDSLKVYVGQEEVSVILPKVETVYWYDRK